MIYLKDKVIIFLLTFIIVFQIGIVCEIDRLGRMIEHFEPVIVTQEVTPEPTPEPTATPSPSPTATPTVKPTAKPTATPEPTFPLIDCPLSEDTQRMIYEKSEEYYIDFPLVMAIIKVESSFRPEVVSYNGSSVGLMQINKVNHKWLSKELGITDFYDEEQNVEAGLYMLRDLFDKYDDTEMVLIAYNMGEAGAKRLWDRGIYGSTYAEKVMRQAEIYEEEIENGWMQ